MKKVFAIILIVCLAVGVAFAAKSENEIKVGAQAGYGGQSITLKYDDSNKINVSNGGFYFAATGEYAFSEALEAKVEAGLNTMGKAKSKVSTSLATLNNTADSASPVHFSVYAGAQYNIELSDEMSLGLGAGWDMMIGKESDSDDAKTNAAMGLGLEAVGAYELQDNLAITLGFKFGWHFINTDDDIQDAYTTADDNDWKASNITYKIFAGVTYSL